MKVIDPGKETVLRVDNDFARSPKEPRRLGDGDRSREIGRDGDRRWRKGDDDEDGSRVEQRW